MAYAGNQWIHDGFSNNFGLFEYNFYEEKGLLDAWVGDQFYWLYFVRTMTVVSCILSFISTLLPSVHYFYRKFDLAKITVSLLVTATIAMLTSLVTYTIAPKILNEVFYGCRVVRLHGCSYRVGWLSVVKVTLFTLIIMKIHGEDDF